jgi:hypothetical protein
MPESTIFRTPYAGAPETEQYFSNPSTQYNPGDLLKLVNGVFLQCAAQTDKPTHLYKTLVTPAAILRPTTINLSTAACEQLIGIPILGRLATLQHALTGIAAPPITAGACQTNAVSTTVIVASGSGTAGDYVGGTIMVNELGVRGFGQRIITASTYAGGNYTFTINKPFGPDILGLSPPAPYIATLGNTVTIVPFSGGMYGVKLNPTTPSQGVSTAKGDITGGTVRIEDVDLTIGRQTVMYSCPNFF